MLKVFAVSLFISAVLLFSVEPMSAKMLLPMFGGTPAVWNTCMVFYQAALLAGYVYAHLTAKWFGTQRQALMHLGLLALAAFALPVAFATPTSSSLAAAPLAELLKMLLFSLGLPFFLVSATAPMLQTWFSRTGHRQAHDPYFLYAASNLGSMIALVAYPVVIEPFLPLREQSWTWTAGYLVMGGLIAACAFIAKKYTTDAGLDPSQTGGLSTAEADAPAPTFTRKLHWLALAAVPSSLLLGVTNYITTDIAAVPLIWVVPLILYLLSFVIVFSRKPLLGHSFMVRAQAVLVLPVALEYLGQGLPVTLLLHLAAFFACAMVCHGELARTRPHAAYLTEFYIWMSAGGILGGAFNALAAPILFNSLLEYPLAIILACLLRPPLSSTRTFGGLKHDLLQPLLLAGLLVVAGLATPGGLFKSASVASVSVGAVAGILCLRFSNRPLRFALGISVVILTISLFSTNGTSVLYSERSFFGILKVSQQKNGRFNTLYHGMTLHGAQSTEPGHRTEPLSYYSRTSPIGQVLELPTRNPAGRRVAIVGLGTGTLASYAASKEHWTFYEINPAVVQIAEDRRYFTFMSDSPAKIDVVLGDARLSLASAPEGEFDIIVLDAFSSDAIPVHLLTEEALKLYLSKLARGGLITIHISNRYLDLTPVLAALAQKENLFDIVRTSLSDDKDRADFKFASRWVVLARDKADVAALANKAGWQTLAASSGTRPWTDDFTNIFSVLSF